MRELDKNPVEILQPFLGTDNGVSFRNRKLRSDFNLQISVPIVSYYLELLKQDSEDKILSYGNELNEPNPFLGLRAIRFTLKDEKLFKDQIRAILRAGVNTKLRIMFPMIQSVDEFIKAKSLCIIQYYFCFRNNLLS